MKTAQPGILQPVPRVARYVFFSIAPGAARESLREALARLADIADGEATVLAIGPSLVAAAGAAVPGLHEFPDMSGHGVSVPSTPVLSVASTWPLPFTMSSRSARQKVQLAEKVTGPAFTASDRLTVPLKEKPPPVTVVGVPPPPPRVVVVLLLVEVVDEVEVVDVDVVDVEVVDDVEVVEVDVVVVPDPPALRACSDSTVGTETATVVPDGKDTSAGSTPLGSTAMVT